MLLSFVVPCYNEEDNVDLFYAEAVRAIREKTDDFELIFINDGSKDGTLKKLKEIARRSDARVKVVNFSRNFGKEAGIYAGLRHAQGEYTCIIDADMQQRPEVAMEMLDILQSNPDYDCVAAYQKERQEGRLLTFYKNTFYKLINRMSEVEFVSGASDFRMLNRKMVDAVLSMSEYYRFSKGLFAFVGFNTYFMPYEVQARANGASKWSFWKLFQYAVEGIVSFSTAPLRLTTVLGLIFAGISFVYLLVVILQKLIVGIEIAGYPTLVALILLLGGIQLLALGIIGEYLARNYVETKRRPVYIVRDVIESGKERETGEAKEN